MILWSSYSNKQNLLIQYDHLFLLKDILVHIYFAIRPETLFYLRSMVLGWITKDELLESHDPLLWKVDEESDQ